MKIVVVGDKPDFLKFLKESLLPLNLDLVFIDFAEILKYTPPAQEPCLYLIDCADEDSDRYLDIIRQIRQKPTRSNRYLYALLREKDIRLRYRLVETGVDDYLVLPFDKLDLQVKVRNLVRLTHQERRAPAPEKFNVPEWIGFISEFGKSLIRINSDKLIEQLIRFIGRELQADYLFYFTVKNHAEIELNLSEPDQKFGSPIIINIEKLPSIIKAVRLREASILNQVKSDNPINLYFKSLLNIDIKSFAIHPVIVEENTVSILMILKTKSQKFQDWHFRQADLSAKLISTGLQIKEYQVQIKNHLDEKVFKYSYEYLQQIINRLNFGLLVVDTQKKIKYLNQPACDLFNIELDNVLYLPLTNILGQQNTDTIFSSQETEGTYERPEIEIIGKEGEKILIGFNRIAFIDDVDKEAGSIITLKDITYSKELQEEMRRIDRLASLGVMASGIAHEIRNPLAGIKAIAQTFEEELSPGDPKNEFVKRIVRQVNRLDDMLKTLFSYAKPQKPNRQFSQIEEIIQEVLVLLKQKFQKQNIKLIQTFPPNLPPLFIDNSQIQQVIFNLILNSIEAIEGGGEVKITVEANVEAYKPFARKPFHKKITENPFVLIHISDSGFGIPTENLNQIFNPFFTTKTFGTGLGLSIVYQIVKENDGIIYFESEMEKGTECYLFLPAFNAQLNSENAILA